MKWRLLDTGLKDPYMNMAIDEAILQLMEKDSLPVLRFYDWSCPAISIGYSQRINEIEDVKSKGLPIVRRPTGGGVVYHGTDVTYSVVLPKGFGIDMKDLYFYIQSKIKIGLEKLGFGVTQYRIIEKATPRYCSKIPSFGDIMIGEKKIGGLAGRRIRGKILCQGYLELGIDKMQIRNSIIENWYAELIRDTLRDEELELASRLCESKYSQDEWNFMR